MINSYVPVQVHFMIKKKKLDESVELHKEENIIQHMYRVLSENFPLLFYTHSCAINFVFFLSKEKTATEIALIFAWLIPDP